MAEQRISLTAYAEAVGIPRRRLEYWFRHRNSRLHEAELARLADYYHIDINDARTEAIRPDDPDPDLVTVEERRTRRALTNIEGQWEKAKTPEAKARMSQRGKGRKKSEKHAQKIGESLRAFNATSRCPCCGEPGAHVTNDSGYRIWLCQGCEVTWTTSTAGTRASARRQEQGQTGEQLQSLWALYRQHRTPTRRQVFDHARRTGARRGWPPSEVYRAWEDHLPLESRLDQQLAQLDEKRHAAFVKFIDIWASTLPAPRRPGFWPTAASFVSEETGKAVDYQPLLVWAKGHIDLCLDGLLLLQKLAGVGIFVERARALGVAQC